VDSAATGTLLGSLLAALSGLFAIRQWYVHRDDETDKQRSDREQSERHADLARYDQGVWAIIKTLQADQVRTDAEVAELRKQNLALHDELINVRGDLVQAGITIRTLTADNARLAARVRELEKHNGEGGG
jgi:hypothetical protein